MEIRERRGGENGVNNNERRSRGRNKEKRREGNMGRRGERKEKITKGDIEEQTTTGRKERL